MADIKKEIEDIQKKYLLGEELFRRNDSFLSINELFDDIGLNLSQYIFGKVGHVDSVAVYPAGSLGKDIVDTLYRNSDIIVKNIIDNNSKESSYNNIPIFQYDDWLKKDSEDVLLITSSQMHYSFIAQLALDGYKGEIIDVWEWLVDTYEDLYKYVDNYYRGGWAWNYKTVNMFINRFMDEHDCDEKKRFFKCMIYGLIEMRDFYYAEKYIESIKGEPEYYYYKKMIDEIVNVIKEVANKADQNERMVIHIVDSLCDSAIDKMPWLQEYSNKCQRLKGMTVQYSTTHFAINTMFTGKDVYDIELGTDIISSDDSELLQYICSNMEFSMVSANNHIMDEFYNINRECDRTFATNISSVLFEGLCLLNEVDGGYCLALHSCGEVHAPFYHIGDEVVETDKVNSREQMYEQYEKGLKYADEQLKWYMRFYEKMSMINIIAGDHGLCHDVPFHYCNGIKKDFSVYSIEEITPAFIVNNSNSSPMIIEGLFSATNINNMLLDLLKDNRVDYNSYNRSYVILQSVPGYSMNYILPIISKGLYGLYEGLIGVRTDNEVYLKYATGKEALYVPKEKKYRNLIDDIKYINVLDRCRDMLGKQVFPIQIYGLSKYNNHLNLLKIFDNDSYEIIIEQLEEG